MSNLNIPASSSTSSSSHQTRRRSTKPEQTVTQITQPIINPATSTGSVGLSLQGPSLEITPPNQEEAKEAPLKRRRVAAPPSNTSPTATIQFGSIATPSLSISSSSNSQKNTALLEAVKKNEITSFHQLLSSGIDINTRDEDGNTALTFAVRRNNILMVEALCKSKEIRFDLANDLGFTPLDIAIKKGSVLIVELLVKHGADVNTKNAFGYTPLMQTFIQGSTEPNKASKIARLLLETKKVNLNEIDFHGNTALNIVIEKMRSGNNEFYKEAYRLILEPLGVDRNLLDEKPEKLLCVAIYKNLTQVARLLISAKNVDVNANSFIGESALIVAAQKGNKDAAELLLARGAEINAASEDGNTAWKTAASFGQTDIVELFLSRGAEINAVNEEGETALLVAARNGNEGTVKFLLSKGADVHAFMKEDSETILMLAAKQGFMAITELLLVSGAEINAVNEEGETALMLVAQSGHTDMARFLLDEEANINAVDECGNTALMLAAGNGHKDTARLLLDRGASLNNVNIYGRNALKLAAEDGYEEIIKLLLKHPDIHVGGEIGQALLTLVRQIGYQDTVEILERMRLNGMQKYLLKETLGPYFEEFQKIISPTDSLKALKLIYKEEELSTEDNSFLESLNTEEIDLLAAVEFIRQILRHPHPQNRSIGVPESVYSVGREEGMVYFRDSTRGLGYFHEPEGLLSLSKNNDNTRLPIDKKTVVKYVQEELFNPLKEQLEEKVRGLTKISEEKKEV